MILLVSNKAMYRRKNSLGLVEHLVSHGIYIFSFSFSEVGT